MKLTRSEREIVRLLRRDPLTTSEALAEALGTTRSAVNTHLSNLGKRGVIRGRGYILDEERAVVVVGGANMDVKARSGARVVPGTSNPGRTTLSPGGVGRNIAENLARLGGRTSLVSAVGDDELGRQVLSATAQAGVHVEHVRRTPGATGTYTAVLGDDGELVTAVSDMAATDAIDTAQVDAARDLIAAAPLLVLEANLSLDVLSFALDLAGASETPVLIDPVSVPKAARLAPLITADRPIDVISPNRDELAALTRLPVRDGHDLGRAATALHRRGVANLWVRLGREGSFLSGPGGQHHVPARHVEPRDVVDVTGAGDAMVAAFCHAQVSGSGAPDAATYAHIAAALTVTSPHTVRPDLTDRMLRSSW